eukprot:CAMPEP_0205901366 /NCGR_PEP_ID=MMETSP1083-20121108/27643_1 /ASSEMBLY_ACC=CAM_ASM_000430 /TAXON_ID=97485 /ORGANISM="Prymnesium parvum, Strain Texoma1" /LENGTH=41 /DNA_ID= /DNA_START= /DNA_END= /DNA_ORIENTATION=
MMSATISSKAPRFQECLRRFLREAETDEVRLGRRQRPEVAH